MAGSQSGHERQWRGLNNPRGIAFDSSGRLYVANNNISTVTVYRRGQQNPSRTITAGVNSPTFVTVDGADDLFVASPYAQHNYYGVSPRPVDALPDIDERVELAERNDREKDHQVARRADTRRNSWSELT